MGLHQENEERVHENRVMAREITRLQKIHGDMMLLFQSSLDQEIAFQHRQNQNKANPQKLSPSTQSFTEETKEPNQLMPDSQWKTTNSGWLDVRNAQDFVMKA